MATKIMVMLHCAALQKCMKPSKRADMEAEQAKKNAKDWIK